MKIIYRNSDNIVIWGTNDNNIQVEVINNDFLVDGVVVAKNVNENQFSLLEDNNEVLSNPFFVGYVTYVNNYLTPTQSYLDWNLKIHNCITSVRNEYYNKSQNPEYSEKERASFVVYYSELDVIYNNTYIDPSWTFPCPPDEINPYYPPCFF
jgi:hypothetical protein